MMGDTEMQWYDEEVHVIGMIVFERALEIFERCGAASDFCVQSASDTGAVFGGTNRLLWSLDLGFRPDPAYCTTRFLEAYQAHFGAPADVPRPTP